MAAAAGVAAEIAPQLARLGFSGARDADPGDLPEWVHAGRVEGFRFYSGNEVNRSGKPPSTLEAPSPEKVQQRPLWAAQNLGAMALRAPALPTAADEQMLRTLPAAWADAVRAAVVRGTRDYVAVLARAILEHTNGALRPPARPQPRVFTQAIRRRVQEEAALLMRQTAVGAAVRAEGKARTEGVGAGQAVRALFWTSMAGRCWGLWAALRTGRREDFASAPQMARAYLWLKGVCMHCVVQNVLYLLATGRPSRVYVDLVLACNAMLREAPSTLGAAFDAAAPRALLAADGYLHVASSLVTAAEDMPLSLRATVRDLRTALNIRRVSGWSLGAAWVAHARALAQDRGDVALLLAAAFDRHWARRTAPEPAEAAAEAVAAAAPPAAAAAGAPPIAVEQDVGFALRGMSAVRPAPGADAALDAFIASSALPRRALLRALYDTMAYGTARASLTAAVLHDFVRDEVLFGEAGREEFAAVFHAPVSAWPDAAPSAAVSACVRRGMRDFSWARAVQGVASLVPEVRPAQRTPAAAWQALLTAVYRAVYVQALDLMRRIAATVPARAQESGVPERVRVSCALECIALAAKPRSAAAAGRRRLSYALSHVLRDIVRTAPSPLFAPVNLEPGPGTWAQLHTLPPDPLHA